ncbi:aminoglycoside phosphotransferase family protein [Paenibacillus sp. chi10]|uniref:Aminoglycoside phosphotransferase family protein n=1 Tax=Paenibacillus suaedae TaxID=3077233 RepID=A0AAJ2JZY8_9BACL|nr:aminoglycoside phosphotransferase family protein [Paenibacillus sp. chi10]MDT8978859.1 aminoglycoside phosphotransferase family protein [Paenibacillus sp. chi10]
MISEPLWSGWSRTLEQAYSIGQVIYIEPLAKGTSSDAKLVVASEGKYVLRKLKSELQGKTEYEIANRLQSYNITPPILLAAEDVCIKLDEAHYNLQPYMDSIERQQIDYLELGQTVGQMHLVMQQDDNILEQPDRFDLAVAWNNVHDRYRDEKAEWLLDLQAHVTQVISYQHEKNCLIHADLGMWNVIYTHSGYRIIDFGETRYGNTHFDLAALLDSGVKWDGDQEDSIRSLRSFIEGYMLYGKVDADLLLENIHLWIMRGMVAIIDRYGQEQRTLQYCSRSMQKMTQMKEVVEHLFSSR